MLINQLRAILNWNINFGGKNNSFFSSEYGFSKCFKNNNDFLYTSPTI